jgi:phage-related minor tail protein
MPTVCCALNRHRAAQQRTEADLAVPPLRAAMIRSNISKLSPAQEMIMRRVATLFAALVTGSTGWAQAQQAPALARAVI